MLLAVSVRYLGNKSGFRPFTLRQKYQALQALLMNKL